MRVKSPFNVAVVVEFILKTNKPKKRRRNNIIIVIIIMSKHMKKTTGQTNVGLVGRLV